MTKVCSSRATQPRRQGGHIGEHVRDKAVARFGKFPVQSGARVKVRANGQTRRHRDLIFSCNGCYHGYSMFHGMQNVKYDYFS